MARINLAFIQGYITKDPQVIKNKDGEYKRAVLRTTLCRGNRIVGDNRTENRYDTIDIVSEDDYMCKQISEIKKGDIIRAKGVFTTAAGVKIDMCKHCGRVFKKSALLSFLTPIKIDLVKTGVELKEGFDYIFKNKEISNQFYCFGKLVMDPVVVKTSRKTYLCQYQLKLDRKYVIRSDSPDIRADSPWVKSYGKNAEEDLKRLHKGSEVFIDGFLQTRYFDRKFICGQAIDDDGKPLFDEATGKPLILTDLNGEALGCGKENVVKEYATELVPYETEYISDYETDEILVEKSKMGEEKASQIVNNVDSFDIYDFLGDNNYSDEDIKYGLDTEDQLDG